MHMIELTLMVQILAKILHSVMQPYRNSLKIDTFWEAITSELMISSYSENSYLSEFIIFFSDFV